MLRAIWKNRSANRRTAGAAVEERLFSARKLTATKRAFSPRGHFPGTFRKDLTSALLKIQHVRMCLYRLTLW